MLSVFIPQLFFLKVGAQSCRPHGHACNAKWIYHRRAQLCVIGCLGPNQVGSTMHNPKSVRPAVAKCREFFMTCREMSRIFYDFLTPSSCRNNHILSRKFVANVLWRTPQVNSHLVWPLEVENDSAQIIRETAVPSKTVTTCSWHVMAGCASWGSKGGPYHAGSSLTRSCATKTLWKPDAQFEWPIHLSDLAWSHQLHLQKSRGNLLQTL